MPVSDTDPRMDRLTEAAAFVRGRTQVTPKAAVILGTGIGGVAESVESPQVVEHADVPGMPQPTVVTHAGRMVFGRFAGTPVVVLEGRLHGYEGHPLEDVVFPVRLARLLGAEILVTTAACGGINPAWSEGELVLVEDHLNLMGDNPLIGPNLDALGPRFPDMSEPYDPELRRRARRAALDEGVVLNPGVLAAWSGPALETRAEYRMLRTLGADAVTMSTIPEVIAARHAAMRVLGLCIITDMCLPDALEPVELSRIIAIAEGAAPGLARIIARVVGQL